MAIKHNYTIFCENVIRDAEGRISHIGVFENIRAPAFPGMLLFWIDINFAGGPDEEFEVSLVAPDGTVVFAKGDRVEAVTNLESPLQRISTHSIVRVQMVAEVEGEYNAILKSGQATIATTPLSVFIIPGAVEEQK